MNDYVISTKVGALRNKKGFTQQMVAYKLGFEAVSKLTPEEKRTIEEVL